MPTCRATPTHDCICFCSEASARCWSDFTAPSVLPRIVATSPFEKLNTNFSVSTCCCSSDSRSISVSRLSRPIECIASISAESPASCGSGTSSSGCTRLLARKWSIARLCAIRKSQAEKGADWKRKRPIASSMRTNVCVVRSSASWRFPTLTCR